MHTAFVHTARIVIHAALVHAALVVLPITLIRIAVATCTNIAQIA